MQQNDVDAQYGLIFMYLYGQSVRENPIKAKKWYGKACDNGNREGCDKYKDLNSQ